MFRFTQKLVTFFGVLMFLAVPMSACEEKPPPLPKIDLQQVDEAFQKTQGIGFQAWMDNFQWTVNEIYTKKDFISVDARRVNGLLHVYGFVERNNTPGYQLNDELIFAIKQFRKPGFLATSFGYRVEDHIGWAPPAQIHEYKTAPSFGFYGSVILISTWRPYYTPRTVLVGYGARRSAYRKSGAYAARRAAASKFRSSAKAASASRRSAARASRSRGGKA